MAPLATVEHFEVIEHRVGQFKTGPPRLRSSSSICIDDQKLSIMALSNASPTEPKEGSKPAPRMRSVKDHEVNWTPWSA